MDKPTRERIYLGSGLERIALDHGRAGAVVFVAVGACSWDSSRPHASGSGERGGW